MLFRSAMTNGKNRTLAFQIDEELFQRIKAHLERESARLGRKVTQKFQAEYAEKGYTVSARALAQGKDWNEYLLQRGRTRERGK